MTFIPVPHGVSITWNYLTNGGHVFKNRIWATKTNFTPAEMQTLADDMRTAYSMSNLISRISNDFTMTGVTVTDETAQGQPSVNSAGAGLPGGNASPALPLQVACVCTLRTNLRGRSYRGRFFQSGFTEADQEDGLFIAGVRTDTEGFLDDSVLQRLTADGWVHVIASKQHNGAVTSPAVTVPVIDYVVRSLIPGSQRRRNARP